MKSISPPINVIQAVKLINDNVKIDGNTVFTTSHAVADVFGKRHDNVIRDIKNIIAQTKDIPNDCLLKFEETAIERVNPSGGKSLKSPAYKLNKDAFIILVMGYQGEKAMRFKLAYIHQFNEMEAILRNTLPTPKAITAAISREIRFLAKNVSSPKSTALQRQIDAALLQDLINQHGLGINVESHLKTAEQATAALIQQHQAEATALATDAAAQFFTAYQVLLTVHNLPVNHSKYPDKIAVNLTEIYQLAGQHNLPLPEKLTLTQALKNNPNLVKAAHNIQSIVTKIVLRCWIFKVGAFYG